MQTETTQTDEKAAVSILNGQHRLTTLGLRDLGIEVHDKIPVLDLEIPLSEVVSTIRDAEGFASFIWTVTPEDARWLLDGMGNNRKLSRRYVTRIAQDIEMGHYIYNGKPMLVNKQGVMFDGQHRSEGALKAGASIVTRIEIGHPDSTRHAVDVNSRARTFAHMLGIDGHKKSQWAQAICSWLFRLAEVGGLAGRHSPSPHTLRMVYDMYSKQIEDPAMAIFDSKLANLSLRKHRSLYAAAYIYACEYNQEAAQEFFINQLIFGEVKRDYPSALVRTRIASIHAAGTDAGTQGTTKYMLGILFRSWNYFLESRKVTSLAYQVKHSLPVPKGFTCWGEGIQHFIEDQNKIVS